MSEILSRSQAYKALKDAKDYKPTIKIVWRNLTNKQIFNEYQRMVDFRRILDEYKNFDDYLDGKNDTFEVEIGDMDIERFQLMVMEMLKDLVEVRDRYVVEVEYKTVSTEQTYIKSYPLTNVNLIDDVKVEKDYDIFDGDINLIKKVRIVKLEEPERAKLEGAFLPYNNVYDNYFDLTRYQIGMKEYNLNCLIYAFKMFGCSFEEVKELTLFIKTQNVPQCDLKDIARFVGINIILKVRRKDDKKWYTVNHNVGSDRTINLCLLENHYFIDELVDYTSYSVNNFHEIKNMIDWNIYYKRNCKSYDKKILSSKLIYLMIKNKLLVRMNNEDLLKTQFYGEYKIKEPKALDSGDFKEECYEEKYNTLTKYFYKVDDKWNVGYRDTRKGDDVKRIVSRKYIFADFESATGGDKHIPFMCSYYRTVNSRVLSKDCIVGLDCAIKFLDIVDDHSVIYFHNLGYDLNFIYEHVECYNIIKNGQMVYNFKCGYKGKVIEFRDSYALIPSKLRDFSKMFGLGDIKKEIMPYGLYGANDFMDMCCIDDAFKHISKKDIDEFLVLSKDFIVDGMFDKIEYAKFYCNRDVEILYKGFVMFCKMVKDELDIDARGYLTVSSISNAYFMKNGCYDGVIKISGCRREFIQKTVKGGRCMTRRNEKFKVDAVVNDFDGVSLYPSAMYYFDGFLKGKPKVINVFEPEKYDHYFVKIRITKVGRELDFPLISVVDDNGVLQYKNVCCEMYVDKYGLEDLVEFQRVEYEFIEGYYYDEGFNKKINEVIKYVFDRRLYYKKLKNPVQNIYKLIMNTAYGKTIMKEHIVDNVIIGEDEYNNYVYRNHNYIKDIVKVGRKYWIRKVKTKNEHFSYPQVGTMVLSYSKRIMNKVFGVAADNGLSIFYQDTDSLHILDNEVEVLAKKYEEKYGFKLIGKGLGQFHNDFSLGNANGIVSTKSVFLGKKTYVDYLLGSKGERGYHCRFKGIPGECVKVVSGNDEFGLYERMLEGERVEFDLVKGVEMNRPVFDNKNGVVRSMDKFIRAVDFNGVERGEDVKIKVLK